MTDTNTPREAESMPVTLAHILGNVNILRVELGNGLEKFGEVKAEVIQHRGQINVIQSEVQQLQSDAKASARAVIDAEEARQTTAQLLKEATKKALDDAKAADDKKVLDAKTLVEQSANTWLTPMRLAAIFGTVFAGLGVALAVYVALKG